MFRIKESQIAAMRGAQAQAYVDQARRTLRRFFPDHCRSVGSDHEINSIIHEAIKAAATRGIVTEYDVIKYLALTFAFGGHPEGALTRARAGTVSDDDDASRSTADRLYSAAKETLSDVGPSSTEIAGVGDVRASASSLLNTLNAIERCVDGDMIID